MFSALTQPNFPKAAIGIEGDSITAVAIRKERRGQYGIKQAAAVELPRNLLVPSFLETNISNPAEFRSLLVEAVTTAGLMDQKRWSVSLPGNTGRAAILTLDTEPGSAKETEDILDWKAEQSFGAPAGTMRISKFKIDPDRDGKARYFATAVKLSVIDEYETVFEDLGWKAGLILPRAVSEARWLSSDRETSDSLLISSQVDGFTALLMRGGLPRVVRSVTCSNSEIDDEIYRLLMFYRDRFNSPGSGSYLKGVLAVGKDFVPARLAAISQEALGGPVDMLMPEDVGLLLPPGGFHFDDIAAPAGLAALGYR
jgi:hypothetical protein